MPENENLYPQGKSKKVGETMILMGAAAIIAAGCITVGAIRGCPAAEINTENTAASIKSTLDETP